MYIILLFNDNAVDAGQTVLAVTTYNSADGRHHSTNKLE